MAAENGVGTMKALVFYEHGGLDKLSYTDVPVPAPGPHEALVQVKAVALNRLDLWTRGGIPGLNLAMPHIGGSDIPGVVAAGGGAGGRAGGGQRGGVEPAPGRGGGELCLGWRP